MCTPKNQVTVAKSVHGVCNATDDSITLTYSISMGNLDASNRVVDVIDTLDSKLSDDYIIESSITGGGTLSNGVITWEDLDLNASSSLLLQYDVEIPSNGFGSYSNTVVVEESGVERGRDVAIANAQCLPATAIADDARNIIVIAIAAIVLGGGFITIGGPEFIGKRIKFKSDIKSSFEEELSN